MESSAGSDWWVESLIGLIVVTVVWSFIKLPEKLFGRRKKKVSSPIGYHRVGGSVRLVLRLDLLMVGLLVSVLFLGFTAIMFGTRNENDTDAPWVYVSFIAFGSVGLYLIAAYFRVRHELIEGGIRYRKTFQRGGVLMWNDVQSVTYSKMNKHFTLKSGTGVKVRVSAFTRNLVDFADAVLTNVRASAIDNKALKLLVDTTKGNPPNPWT